MNGNSLFPKVANNHYQGNKVAKWLLFVYVFKSIFSGSIHMFAADGGAQSIASVTLDRFSEGGAESVVTMFGLWGMEQVIIGLIGVVILWRYNSLIPLLWAAYALEYIGRGAAALYTPGLTTANTPPGASADLVLIPLAITMFILSMIKKN